MARKGFPSGSDDHSLLSEKDARCQPSRSGKKAYRHPSFVPGPRKRRQSSETQICSPRACSDHLKRAHSTAPHPAAVLCGGCERRSDPEPKERLCRRIDFSTNGEGGHFDTARRQHENDADQSVQDRSESDLEGLCRHADGPGGVAQHRQLRDFSKHWRHKPAIRIVWTGSGRQDLGIPLPKPALGPGVRNVLGLSQRRMRCLQQSRPTTIDICWSGCRDWVDASLRNSAFSGSLNRTPFGQTDASFFRCPDDGPQRKSADGPPPALFVDAPTDRAAEPPRGCIRASGGGVPFGMAPSR